MGILMRIPAFLHGRMSMRSPSFPVNSRLRAAYSMYCLLALEPLWSQPGMFQTRQDLTGRFDKSIANLMEIFVQSNRGGLATLLRR